MEETKIVSANILAASKIFWSCQAYAPGKAEYIRSSIRRWMDETTASSDPVKLWSECYRILHKTLIPERLAVLHWGDQVLCDLDDDGGIERVRTPRPLESEDAVALENGIRYVRLAQAVYKNNLRSLIALYSAAPAGFSFHEELDKDWTDHIHDLFALSVEMEQELARRKRKAERQARSAKTLSWRPFAAVFGAADACGCNM